MRSSSRPSATSRVPTDCVRPRCCAARARCCRCSRSCISRRRRGSDAMEFESLERCAAYVAAQDAAEAIDREARRWPPRVATLARQLAEDAVCVTTEALGYAPSSPQRRRGLRAAIAVALEVAVACDAACALGLT